MGVDSAGGSQHQSLASAPEATHPVTETLAHRLFPARPRKVGEGVEKGVGRGKEHGQGHVTVAALPVAVDEAWLGGEQRLLAKRSDG
ncbi:hypothetical protein GCM10025867_07990 [Frondihabitans sucicola]|uniref:Uncharacterized protein n=1 Tax=Frondihabitans sucicola TaxID=1268041 RepID=A0ABM8GJK5_9MICO|nr:hypothetical protein [Frondihabitans sucicola]BDZ48558.1 hypothetical protein GCM10025867_07990 [Frondihabitans sucicola]